MKLIFSYIRKHIGMFLIAISFLCLEIFADLMQPTFMSYIVDNGVKEQDLGKILHYGLMMLGIALLGAFGAVMRNLYAGRTSQLIGREIRSDIYRKVQTLSFENIDRLQPASIITRITNDVTQVQNFINGCMRIMVKAPITCIGAIILIIYQTPKQFPILLVLLLLAGCLIAANMKLGYPRFGRLQQKLDRLNQVSREFLSSIRVVKAFGAEDEETEKFRAASLEFAAAGVSSSRVSAVFSPLINLSVNMGIIALLWFSRSQDAGQIGRLMASVNYMTQVLFALGRVSNILNAAVRATASSRRISEVLEEEPAQHFPKGSLSQDNTAITGNITFRHVSFSYADAPQPALRDLSFDLAAGKTIGIIGPTGSGKTTLVNLVPRFYDVTQGEILIDGQNINEITVQRLRQAIAVVPQKALLFTGTIAENLRWGDADAPMERLREAAEIACADSFISEFETGYDTVLGQGGVNLSGGQKQRLSIARALLRSPKILILDDCTSALDAVTERRVLNRLREKVSHMTVLLISQRVSTVMQADCILCMENGKLQGYGSHKELLESCPAYRAIYTSQIGGGNIG